jgi:two-component system phosphate regulon response regulator PhoB
MSAHILLVEDESAIREMLRFALSSAGFEISEAEDSLAAQQCIDAAKPDLILLDWMLPGLSGVDFTKRLKSDEATQEIPIIMLTAKAEEDNKIKGFESGADDYITKPFSTRELLARIKAVLRRSQGEASENLVIGQLTLDPKSHRVTATDAVIDLGPTEYRLLKFFMSHQDRVYSRNQVLDQVWGSGVYVEDRTVDVHIRRLRKALEPHGLDAIIQTVRGAGYRCSAQS